MDFIDVIKALGDKVSRLKESIHTEEATKNAFVMPFIAALGYDVFNPMEVIPEFVADLGIKKGEKVDYCIQKDGKPIIIVECKHWKEELNVHNSQLHRYFHVCETRFGILTNGIIYRFYTDLEEPNKMDNKPFWEFNITEMSDAAVGELKKYNKNAFNVEQILTSANELKYSKEIRQILSSELNSPTEAFVRFFAKQIHAGVVNAKVIELFTPILKRAFNQYVSDMISDRLKTALSNEEAKANPPALATTEVVEEAKEENNGLEFTELEQEAFFIVKSILRTKVDSSRIFYRDTQSYLNVLLDDSIRRTICRLYLNSAKKYIGILDESKKLVKYEIACLDDIYTFSDQLVSTALSYDNVKETA